MGYLYGLPFLKEMPGSVAFFARKETGYRKKSACWLVLKVHKPIKTKPLRSDDPLCSRLERPLYGRARPLSNHNSSTYFIFRLVHCRGLAEKYFKLAGRKSKAFRTKVKWA